ncbi:Probable DNA endonuclease SmrA [Serratia entomophila]|jgi:DNA-nicking Smr family endonuclease|uniref:DNA endonuclease SmrA n=1 Tax=Serratia entomophila TaxID=42906 RepID=UPI001F24778F|nr:DNA endonuclease SmrA [Serratia entomophila]UIW17423.1 DNA endonuclease SmrA [Serratia entomophila]CAI1116716.1 Probable DNA endonuclease SmrA [Serratia entomophila]CAI1183522.1 Probable DNA endonuclease SmrA [Serratia entomophila]CAI1712998.1 Probable DNA endonuclease SmrA [Serratia entomophila]CAI1788224.1 Probable DNA endonuclease SmrA [Serratia entomophila]
MSNQEKDDFEQAMAGVIPLASGRQTLYLKPEQALDKSARREAQRLQLDNFLSTGFLEVIPCEQPLEFRGEGIQQGVLDKLRNGRYPPQATLNLLKLSVEASRQALFRFILQAEAQNLRSVLIVHGRGRQSESHPNIVRSYVAKWLAQFEQVQAFCRALPRDGGEGACYVTLRKSAQAKADNFERHAKRSR